MNFELTLMIIEYIGTIAFAISGAIIAIENKMDILGVMILGTTTAVGGGIMRDVIIGRDVPVVFDNPSYLIVSFITTILVFVTFVILKKLEITKNKIYKIVLNITDSLGLGVFVIIGTTSTLNAGINNHLLVIFCSVLTAVGGGVLRDIMAAKIPGIFRKHIYCVVAIFGALFFYILLINTPENVHNIITISTILLVVIFRFLAFHFELNLPKVRIEEN
jgi:uncharacterized membrane protein YeiH